MQLGAVDLLYGAFVAVDVLDYLFDKHLCCEKTILGAVYPMKDGASVLGNDVDL